MTVSAAAASADPDVIAQLAHAGQFLVAAVFAVAAWTKLRRPAEFVAAVRGYTIVPERASGAAAIAILAAEAIVALALLTGVAAAAAAVAAVVLLAVFLAAVVAVLRRGTEASCGCFGAPDETITHATVARLGGLLALTGGLLLAWVASGRDPVTVGWIADQGSRGLEEAFVAATIAAWAFVIASFLMSSSSLRALLTAQRAGAS